MGTARFAFNALLNGGFSHVEAHALVLGLGERRSEQLPVAGA